MRFGRLTVCALVICAFLLSFGQVFAKDRTIKDAVGRTVKLKPKAMRIVTSFKPVTLCVLALKLQDRLVGVDTSSRKDKLQKAVFPGIAKLTDVGRKMTGLNFETIVGLKPDLVLMYAQKDGVKTADRLVKAGIPAIVVLPETFDSLKSTLRLIAEAVGEPQLADAPIAATDRVLELAKQKVGDIKPGQRKSVYFASSLGFFSTASGTMLMNDIVEAAGGTMVSHELKGYFKNISPETFIKWNPQLITVNSRSINLAKETLTRPEFKQVAGVASGEVYPFPCNLAPWDFPSPLTALSVLWMGKTLYPQRFSTVELDKEIDAFHKALFGMTFTQMGGKIGGKIKIK
jgi:iron complex transport system substrate-binding protein